MIPCMNFSGAYLAKCPRRSAFQPEKCMFVPSVLHPSQQKASSCRKAEGGFKRSATHAYFSEASSSSMLVPFSFSADSSA